MNNLNPNPGQSRRLFIVLTAVLLPLLVVFAMLMDITGIARADNPLSNLDIEIIAGYNLVVDSNIQSPSTYGPSVATVIGKFCNTGSADLTNVIGYIGDYTGPSPVGGTPGIYPSRSHTGLDGTYSFTHLGGASDAIRYMGTIPDGECRVQYWSFTYPRCENNQTPPCSGGNDPVFLEPTVPGDDLYLTFDVWGTADGDYNDATWKMFMRNELSAMANKIEPNPDGYWDTIEDTVNAGDVVRSHGYLYTFGNVNKGFDNDGDLLPDYNAWVQPFGDPAYDPSCFRLLRTTGTLTVTRSSNPPMILNFTDNLYFTDLPADNTNVVGQIYYTFLALGGVCYTNMTPYQEAASGMDNEKFNFDFGGGSIPPLYSVAPAMTFSKTGESTVSVNDYITYQIAFTNTGSTNIGILSAAPYYVELPFTIQDTLPLGTHYACGTADISGTYAGQFIVLLSTDSGNTWFEETISNCSGTLPATSGNVMVRWQLTVPLAPSTSGTATFDAYVPSGYTTPILIENEACANLGGGETDLMCDDHVTLITGSASIGDFVWRDNDGDGVQDGGGETGIEGITVSLYWDTNNNNELDDGDILIDTDVTDTGGDYGFSLLPEGQYLVVVDAQDPQMPDGYSNTTPIVLDVDLTTVAYYDADFGFGPALKLEKVLVGTSPVNEGSYVEYDIELTNTRPPSNNGYCTYTVWATQLGQNNGGNSAQRWVIDSEPYALGAQGPDGYYANSPYGSGDNILSGTYFPFNGTPYGDIDKVEALYMFYSDGTFTDDFVTLYMYYNNAQVTGATASLNPTQLNTTYNDTPTLITYDWTAFAPGGAWSWSQFTATLISQLELIANADRVGGGDGGFVYMDAMGFRITTDQPCGGADDIIATLPLTDTYNAARLQFVSATPAESSATTGGTDPYANTGTITWENLGPLNAGDTLTVRVKFLALDPGAASAATDNDAEVLSAKFGSGRNVNDASDTASVTINRTAVIGDKVWFDIDGQGDQDTGEPGLPGVTVWLCASTDPTCTSPLQTAITDSNGEYEFVATDGDYYVMVDSSTLPGFTQTYDATTPTTDHRAFVTVSGTDIDTIDFGYDSNNGLIYGSVWEDNNGNAATNPTPEAGENGFANVQVDLCPDATYPCKKPTATTYTDSEGNYVFAGVTTGTSYYIQVYYDTGDMAGFAWTQTLDPDGSPYSNVYQTPTITANVFGSYDFAYRRTPANSDVGDTIYVDWDGDGTQDTGEEGLAGVTVYLYEDADNDGAIDPSTDAVVGTAVTDANGYYLITGIAQDNYIVVVDTATLPAGYQQTADPDMPGTCTLCDNKDALYVDGTNDYLGEDFGYQPRGGGNIGDTVWADMDGDGAIDGNESGIANITVYLYEDQDGDGVVDPEDALIATTTTDADGNYTFVGLPYGDYLVDVDTADADLPEDAQGYTYLLSTDNDPLLVTLDSSNPSNYDADFGFMPSGVIGDFIWQDNDGDGTQDPGEPGIDGVTVQLWTWTWTDSDGDKMMDSGEVSYVDTGLTATTNVTGTYEFENLPPGNYQVRIDPAELESGGTLYGFSQTGDPDARTVPCSSTDPTPADDDWHLDCSPEAFLTLDAGQINRTADFGYRPLGSIGDSLWVDLDNDGTRDDGEPGIANNRVRLCSVADCSSGIVYTTYTDSDGYYSFGNIADGTWYVVVDSPSGYTQTYEKNDASPDNTTTVVLSGGYVASINGDSTGCTSPSNCDLDVDFGYQFAFTGDYSLSGTVFFDSDDDGIAYEGGIDEPYAGVTVYLYNSSNVVISTTTTLTYTVINGYIDIDGDGSETLDADDDLPNLYGYEVIDGALDINDDGFITEADDGTFGPYAVIDGRLNMDGDGDVDANDDGTLAGLYMFNGLPNGSYSVAVDSTAFQLMERNYEADATYNGWTPVTVSGSNINQLDFGFYAMMDCGDLPATYNDAPTGYSVVRASQGPCHVRLLYPDDLNPVDHYLGSAPADWDSEFDGQPDDYAEGDDYDLTGDDEGGMIPITLNGVEFLYDISVMGNNAYLAAWIDWNEDGDFVNNGNYDEGEYIFYEQLTQGTHRLSIPKPTWVDLASPHILHLRFRLYQGFSPPAVIAPTGTVMDGEVEDYRYEYMPTAITLVSLQARALGAGITPVAWIGVGALVGAGALLAVASAARKRKTQ